MKKVISRFSIILLAALTLLVPDIVFAGEALKVDPKQPVFATGVELGRKVLVKGAARPGKPPKVAPTAATGVLGTEASSNRYAIVVGISNYPGNANDLQYCDDDAADVVSALKGVYGFQTANIIVKYNLDATRQNIIDAIRSIKSQAKSPDDEVLFYFSGHGGRGKASDGDAEATDECIWAHNKASLVPIWDGELAAEFSGFGTSRIVFIFDSCYAGGMTDLAGSGRVVAMASNENSLSYEYSSIGNGEFTYWMVEKGMTGSLADRFDQKDGVYDVTVEEAWDYARANCVYDSVNLSDRFTDDLLL